MSLSDSTRSSRWVVLSLAVILTVSLVPHVYWLIQPRERLVGRVAWEDAFYYFQVARNLAAGQGSVSAGGIETNGYHPLWMWLCAGCFRVFGGGDLAAVRAALWCGVVFGWLSVLVLYRLLRALGVGRWASLIATGCYYLNPWMVGLTICGLEAPLQGLLLLLTMYWVHRWGAPGRRGLYYAVLGVLLALVFLVRTDNAFFLAAMGIWLAWRARRDWRDLIGLAVAVAVALGLAAPWLAWNLRHFGSVVQGSAGALPYVRELAFFESHPGAGPGDFLLHRLELLGGFFPAVLWFSGLGVVWYMLAVGVGGALCTRRGREEWARAWGALGACIPLALAVVCLGVSHKFVRLATREWYFVPSDVLLALVLGIALHYLSRVARSGWPRQAFLTAAAVLFVMLLGFKNVREWQARDRMGRDYGLELVQAVESLPIADRRMPVGCTDSGIVGFFSRVPVVNLDGVVNPEAARHIRQGRLLEYVESKGIGYAIVTPRMYNEKVWGSGFQERLKPYPPLSAQGYRLAIEDE